MQIQTFSLKERIKVVRNRIRQSHKKQSPLFTLSWFIPSLYHENSCVANIYIFYKPYDFLYLPTLSSGGQKWHHCCSLFFSGEMPLSKIRSFMGTTNEGWSRNHWSGNSNTSSKGSTKNPRWKSSTKVWVQKNTKDKIK